ncbi:MAG: HNH endonuclease [Clostridiales bacterium]|nr:HNH endonuclease [Clostridiales bacterium]
MHFHQNSPNNNPIIRVKCDLCGFNFEKKYGLLGRGFIHVHHIEMVAEYGGERFINPITDMIPVCPNCHAMLHRKRPPLTPEELKEIIESQVRGEEQ